MLTNPALIALFVCIVSVFVNLVFLDGQISRGLMLYIYGYFIFILMFSVSTLGLKRVLPNLVKTPQLGERKYVVRLYWILACVSLIMSIYTIYTIGFNGQFDQIFLNLRYDHTIESMGSYYGAQHFALFGLALSLYYAYRGFYVKAGCASLVYLVSALSIAERTSIFFAFVSIFYLLFFIGRGKIVPALCGLAFLIFIFVAIAIGAGKTGGGGDLDFIPRYIGASITALNDYIYGRSYDGCAELVFGIIARISGPEGAQCSYLIEQLDAKDRFNVYSYVAAPYLYAGWPGVSVFMGLLGVGYALLWHVAKTKGGYFAALLGVYVYAICMMFYAWQFNLTTYFYLSIIFLPLFFRVRLRK